MPHQNSMPVIELPLDRFNPIQIDILHTLLLEVQEMQGGSDGQTLLALVELREYKADLDGTEPGTPAWWKQSY